MTATDELRRLLDEHGVEWGNVRNDGSLSDYVTEWELGNRDLAIATEWAVGSGLSVEIRHCQLTPAQAVEATLGRGTCEQILVNCDDGLMPPFVAYCSMCGKEWGFTPNYCPNCGREVKFKKVQ